MRTEQAPETPAPVESPAPVEASDAKKDPIGLKYRGDGEQHFAGVYNRDLTVTELLDLDPSTVNNITAQHPATGKAVYEWTAAGEKAWAAQWPKGKE